MSRVYSPLRSIVGDEAIILVAVLPHPRDLEIARVLGWYRIPLRSSPKVMSVDFLAFYQTAAFGEEERWGVHYIAAVRGHELTTRAELLRHEADHPRAHEEYYKIQLGELQKVVPPIPASHWRRLTFLYTTGERLNRASTLEDLVVRDEERQILWRGLRERALHQQSYSPQQLPEQLDGLDVLLLSMLGKGISLLESADEYVTGDD
ncbi:hypothetical protein [Bellilinea sp.]|jgi:hypothetical protein|uniref:hypothetical protein n=1 Tax=Bellilinea sp. TaxID=2838785 RepID=UPI002ADD5F61|nr:hypothetical protein [Bellilinea sp.]